MIRRADKGLGRFGGYDDLKFLIRQNV